MVYNSWIETTERAKFEEGIEAKCLSIIVLGSCNYKR